MNVIEEFAKELGDRLSEGRISSRQSLSAGSCRAEKWEISGVTSAASPSSRYQGEILWQEAPQNGRKLFSASADAF